MIKRGFDMVVAGAGLIVLSPIALLIAAAIKLDDGGNVGVYAKKDRLIASGLIWPENQDLLVQKSFLMHQPLGQGHVIAFAEDPNFRAYAEGTMLLFMNAVLLGPGY